MGEVPVRGRGSFRLPLRKIDSIGAVFEKEFFLVQRNFLRFLIAKMGVEMNPRIITKIHAADQEIGFLIKSISKPYGRATAMPTAWGLIVRLKNILLIL